MLLEEAPLRLLSIQHTGMTNEDLCMLFHQLAGNPEENATQAYLTCLKLGPAVQWPSSPPEQHCSQAVAFAPDTLHQLISLLRNLPELQVLQVWGLDADQQSCLTDAWQAAKGNPGHVGTTVDSFRVSSSDRCLLHSISQPQLHADEAQQF